MTQIKEANYGMLGMQRVCVVPENLRRQKLGKVAICPGCGEAYPVRNGASLQMLSERITLHIHSKVQI